MICSPKALRRAAGRVRGAWPCSTQVRRAPRSSTVAPLPLPRPQCGVPGARRSRGAVLVAAREVVAVGGTVAGGGEGVEGRVEGEHVPDARPIETFDPDGEHEPWQSPTPPESTSTERAVTAARPLFRRPPGDPARHPQGIRRRGRRDQPRAVVGRRLGRLLPRRPASRRRHPQHPAHQHHDHRRDHAHPWRRRGVLPLRTPQPGPRRRGPGHREGTHAVSRIRRTDSGACVHHWARVARIFGSGSAASRARSSVGT